MDGLLAPLPAIVPARTLVAWPLAVIFSGAAIFTAREFARRLKWGEKGLGALRACGLLAAAGLLVWPEVPPPLFIVALAGGAWLAGRPIRRLLTIGLLRCGAILARRTNQRGVQRLRRIAESGIRTLPPVVSLVARNMRRAGVHRSGLEREYFARAADQMEFLMQILRAGYADSGVGDRFHFDESLSHLVGAHEARRGVLVLSPHLCGYPVFPRVIAEHVPCSIYLRHSPDPAKHALNVLMGQAGGGHLVYPPANGTPAERLNVALGVLRQGRALYVTPDLPRKPCEGHPVSLWDRTVHFPIGAMVMALRTGAAVVFARWFCRDGTYHVVFEEPFRLERRGDRSHQAQQAVVAFAAMMDRHLRQYPEMWWNWLDKRWTRILRRAPARDRLPAQPISA